MSLKYPLSKTPAFVGVLFCALGLVLSSCKDGSNSATKPAPEESTPDLALPSGNLEESAEKPAENAGQTATDPRGADPVEPVINPNKPTSPYKGAKLMFYNVRNYLNMDRRVDGKYVKDAPKPEAEIEALVRLIVANKPDILGLCEIGTKQDLKDLQTRLKTAGLDLNYGEWVQASDPYRHLALLSRFPITKRLSQTKLDYPIDGDRLPMSRGILDVIIDVNDQPLEVLVAHLKSKREVKNHDQAEMRRNEAKLLRQRMTELLEADADARFVVLGDFNDTSKTAPIETLRGKYNTPTFCDTLELKASNGTYWTQFWSWQHVYSRFDYIFLSPALNPMIDAENSFIVDHPDWSVASDHRALIMTFN